VPVSIRTEPLSLTQVVVPWTWTQPAPYCAHGLAVTGAGFFFGCSAAVAAAGNNAIRRTSFPIRSFYRDQRGGKRGRTPLHFRRPSPQNEEAPA
jgi:hypothetical protein